MGDIRPASVSNYPQFHALWFGRKQRKFEALHGILSFWLEKWKMIGKCYVSEKTRQTILIVLTLNGILRILITCFVRAYLFLFAARLRIRSRRSEEQVKRKRTKETRHLLWNSPASRRDFWRKCSSHRIRFIQFGSEDRLCHRVLYWLVSATLYSLNSKCMNHILNNKCMNHIKMEFNMCFVFTSWIRCRKLDKYDSNVQTGTGGT